MRNFSSVVLAVLFWCVVPAVSPVSAQQVSSFEQLQLLVKPGDKIDVIGVDGTQTKGKIEILTPASLRLSTKSGIREFAQKDTFEVRQKRSDSLANGALIGAIATGGVSGVLFAAYCRGEGCNGGEVAAADAIYAGIGAAIGVGVDALINHRQTIYKQHPQTSLGNIDVFPLLGDGRKGALVRFSF
jgi:hypothetical protein